VIFYCKDWLIIYVLVEITWKRVFRQDSVFSPVFRIACPKPGDLVAIDTEVGGARLGRVLKRRTTLTSLLCLPTQILLSVYVLCFSVNSSINLITPIMCNNTTTTTISNKFRMWFHKSELQEFKKVQLANRQFKMISVKFLNWWRCVQSSFFVANKKWEIIRSIKPILDKEVLWTNCTI
jgi:hypothetical protein